MNTNTHPMTRPASSGTCGVVGCNRPADLETQTRTNANTWQVRLDCLDHAPTSALDAMLSA